MGSLGRTHSNRDAPLRARESYEQLKALTRGQAITKTVMQEFVATWTSQSRPVSH